MEGVSVVEDLAVEASVVGGLVEEGIEEVDIGGAVREEGLHLVEQVPGGP